MLTVLMKNPNFLILDEPTNDLDIVTLQTLEDFLEEFKGCVLIVSHDRYFIDRLVDHTFVLEGNGSIKDYPGNYTEYRNWISEQKEEEKENLRNNSVKIAETPKVIAPEVKAPVVKKLSFKLQRELEDLEKEIPEMEAKKLRLEDELASGISDYNEIQKLSDELKALTEELDQKSIRWLELQEEL